MNGALITFEGPDGAGKTSQAECVYVHLRSHHYLAVSTQEPGGTEFSDLLRKAVKSETERTTLAELLTFEASRADLTERVIRPNLEKGHIVLCDRSTDSTLAYQGYGKGYSFDTISSLNRLATSNLIPDLTFLFDVPFEQIHWVYQAHFEKLGRDFYERVRAGYLALARQDPQRIKIVERVPAETNSESLRLTYMEKTLPLVHEILDRLGIQPRPEKFKKATPVPQSTQS